MKRSRNISIVEVLKDTPVSDTISEELLQSAKIHYHYDYMHTHKEYDEDGEEISREERYISRNDAIEHAIEGLHANWQCSLTRDRWIVDCYTRKVVARVKFRIDIERN